MEHNDRRPVPFWVLLLIVALVASIGLSLKMRDDERGEDYKDNVEQQLRGWDD